MWKCKECGRTFPIPARISFEKAPPPGSFDVKRVIVEKACCPFCESIEFEEVEV
jgi:ribosomal protein L37AE/L43A